jgi:hypothetical protein
MRNQYSHTAFIAMPDVRVDVETRDDGDLFVSKVTTRERVYVKPYWLIAKPMELGGPHRFTTAYCVRDPGKDNRGKPLDCPTDLAVQAGVAFIPFNGGNMPADEYLVRDHSESKSGFTGLVFTIAIAAITWGVATWATGIPGFTGPVVSGETASLGGATFGAGAGGAYAIGNLSQGGPLTEYQMRAFGAKGDGRLTPSTTGDAWDPSKAIHDTMVRPDLRDTQGGLQRLYGGGSCPAEWTAQQCADANITLSCPPGWTVLQCAQLKASRSCPESWTIKQCHNANLLPGAQQRLDDYRETNRVKMMRGGEVTFQKHIPIDPGSGTDSLRSGSGR